MVVMVDRGTRGRRRGPGRFWAESGSLRYAAGPDPPGTAATAARSKAAVDTWSVIQAGRRRQSPSKTTSP